MEKYKDCIIREYREDDLDWIINSHGDIYAREYGFDSTFPDYVREPLERFHKFRKENREMIWIAEKDGVRIGVIAIAYDDDETAQLRWFLLDESSRGQGLGNRLMEIAIGFSKEAEYGKVILWTVSILNTARHLYKKHGFTLEEEKPHKIWGKDLIEERWDLVMDFGKK